MKWNNYYNYYNAITPKYARNLSDLQFKNRIKVSTIEQTGYCKSREYRRRLRNMVKNGTIRYWVETAFEHGAIKQGERLKLI